MDGTRLAAVHTCEPFEVIRFTRPCSLAAAPGYPLLLRAPALAPLLALLRHMLRAARLTGGGTALSGALRAGLLLALMAVLPAAGASSQSLSVLLGFDGSFVEGRWSPVRVDVTAGNEPFSGQVEIEIPRSTLLSVEPAYVRLVAPVDAESRTTRRLWLSVPLQSTPHPLYARLVDASGSTVAAQELSLRQGAAADRFALVLDPSGERWTWLLQGNGGPAFSDTATLRRAEDLPGDPLVLSAAAAILVRDDFPLGSLAPAQVSALVDYLRHGGHLVLTGGPTPPALPEALARELPILPSGRVVPVQAGAAAAPAWELVAPEGAVTYSAGGFPLLAGAPVAKGRVTFAAVSPVLPATRTLIPAGAWGAALAAADRRWPYMTSSHQDELWRILGRARIETRLPALLAGALVGYAGLAIGAVWTGRKRRAGFFVAFGLAAAFSLAAHAIASLHGVSDRTGYAELQVAQAVSEGVAVNRTFGMVVSGSPVTFSLDASADFRPPFPAAAGRSGAAAAVTPEGIRFPAVTPGAAVRFMYESLEYLPVTARIERGERTLLFVQNHGDFPLRYAYVVSRDWFAPLGAIAPGGAVALDAPRPVEGSSSFVTISVQSHLERLGARERPTSFEARAISFAVSQALDDAALAGRRDLPLLVALAEPAGVVRLDPSGPSVRKRVIIAPFVEGVPGGRNAN